MLQKIGRWYVERKIPKFAIKITVLSSFIRNEDETQDGLTSLD